MNSMNNTKLTHSTTHYLLTIHKLNEKNDRCKLVDIANALNNARSTVSIAVKKLLSKELVRINKENNVVLTTKSHRIVHNILSNKTLMYYFFTNYLGVSKTIAMKESCLVENLISSETQKKLFSFMKKLDKKENHKYFNSDFDVKQFKSLNEFKEKQLGDGLI